MATDHGDVDEAELLRRLRQGDARALDVLYRNHGPDALRYAHRLSRSGVSAEELVSEAFVRTLGAISRGRGPRDTFRPYLFTVVRRAARHLRWRADVVLAGLDPAPARADARRGADPAAPADETVMVALHRLPDRWQRVLWLVDVEERPVAEVAASLGLTPNATSALVYRARRGLRAAYVSLRRGDQASQAARLAAEGPSSNGSVRPSRTAAAT